MVKYVNCVICGSNAYKIINTCLITKEDADIPERSLDVVRCLGCGLLFVNPQPEFSYGYLQKIYGKEYFSKGYMKFYDTDAQADNIQSNEAFSYRLDFIEKHKKPGSILDIGCATGGFLNLARQRGWEASGVELSEYAAQLAEKKYSLKVFHGSFEEAEFKDNNFDVVCAGDIIEHLRGSLSFLKKVHRILKKEGILYLAFPNAGSFYYIFFGIISRFNKRNYFLLPYHIYHFGNSSIKRLLEKAGFSILELRYTCSKSNSFFMNLFNFRDRIVLIARKEKVNKDERNI